MTVQEAEEFRQDMMESDRQECKLCNSYKAFIDHIEAEIEVLQEALKDIEQQHTMYGHEFNPVVFTAKITHGVYDES